MTTRLWVKHGRQAPEDNGFANDCLRLWDSGLNTKDIAVAVMYPEYEVERVTRLARERRRQKEIDNAEWNAKEKNNI